MTIQINEEEVLLCHDCGECNTHLVGWEVYESLDKPGEDRWCIKLAFWCEDGHYFLVDFQQHKGSTYVSAKMDARRTLPVRQALPWEMP